jgi:hypothetical protein
VAQEYKEGVTQTEVTKGHPVAQKFLIGDVWRTFNLTNIAGGRARKYTLASGETFSASKA